MPMQTRGGIPTVYNLSAPIGGVQAGIPNFIQYLIARSAVASTVPCRMYFSKADFDANARYVTIPIVAAATPHGEWQGPVETDQNKFSDVWFRGVGGTAVIELVTFQRRG